MLALTIISILGLTLLFSIIVFANILSKVNKQGPNLIFNLFYVVLIFVAVSTIILYIK